MNGSAIKKQSFLDKGQGCDWTLLDHVEIKEALGEGHFGTVFKGNVALFYF